MKKVVIVSFLAFFQFFVLSNEANAQNLFVFVSPIKHEQPSLLTQSQLLRRQEHVLLFQNVGISTYCRWIQNIQDHGFVIHLLKGDDLMKSFELLKNKIKQNDEAAMYTTQLYQEVLGVDLGQEDFFVGVKELTPMLQLDIAKEEECFTKEYCFVYPILPSKKEKLQGMFQTQSEYWSQQVQDTYRHRGISKQQLWIQERDDHSFLVIYQEITGPVTEARKKYLDSKEEEFSKNRSREFSEITGLSYEELLPKLESLFDSELLD